ncbi:SDR family NAD(P)-dependent oxidoreductase [Methylobacterium sp. E-041]|jgi:NAD(P)-dependent dehydrogenase (short-subunit alcohol dehydrogenase family)|uniref:SDR family NAD(P)-dependent oxidoreductase n=1 Tax=unclassified Methylobacterium TaxID=2615210 RepID=UPI0011C92C9B|nr:MULTISPECIES: SDR family NAD(P)-dependent oxidoreductase [unclassified Methylobacterium]MCJ2040241.1 SDR family NAD(P)-dependent oxidoreductase [Methylobacterium sp. J-059]MCJ2104225.1 SDR family NAD(P)-dependent oxidoreductase [Methylobacterium sp. E-041]TXM94394.1 SDR family NAD(P)-dependent oxidoreductase [Methylobacterium sp. WL116]TXN40381.1 SDR family NAD(P)-dependent oxidoreductase [Methylobacterium sp. WL93]TXN52532.1 SDR family NAD(P)-dependent oxidoreductase [Methylobacterium sp. 
MTDTKTSLDGRVAVVTGASRGIGRAAALALAEAGAHVIAVARTQGALEELDDAIRRVGSSATLVPLDLTDYDGIDRLGAAINERWKRLDIVVGNAGILGNLMPIGHITPKVWGQVMDVNVTANWRLIRSFDPLLRMSDAGRAIFVTSGAAGKCRAYWGPYSVSKAALEALVRTYAAENETTNVRAMLLNPGPLRTDMRRAAMPGEDPETLRTPEDLAPHFVRLASPASSETGLIYDFPTDRTVSPQAPR